jgi:uncharacterized protein YkwD
MSQQRLSPTTAFALLMLLVVACSPKPRPRPMAPQPPPPPTTPAPPWALPSVPGWNLPVPWPSAPPPEWSQSEWEVVKLVNAARARGGFCGAEFFYPSQALAPQTSLFRAARNHSWDMANRDYFSHDTPEGWGPTDRARANGYPRGAAENIQAGAPNAYAVVNSWLNSPGHCKNLLNPNYREIGVGFAARPATRYGYYWTADLGG